jgi:hydroxymethylpyrimidine pyrophosphatase-like HAD family hydrolase
MIIAVDFDGTLQLPDRKPNTALIDRLRAEQAHGNIVILWTCREGKRLKDAMDFLTACHFRPNLVNENAPQAVMMLKHNPRKVYADVYIDDKNAK